LHMYGRFFIRSMDTKDGGEEAERERGSVVPVISTGVPASEPQEAAKGRAGREGGSTPSRRGRKEGREGGSTPSRTGNTQRGGRQGGSPGGRAGGIPRSPNTPPASVPGGRQGGSPRGPGSTPRTLEGTPPRASSLGGEGDGRGGGAPWAEPPPAFPHWEAPRGEPQGQRGALPSGGWGAHPAPPLPRGQTAGRGQTLEQKKRKKEQ
jgi:hypothetical protein